MRILITGAAGNLGSRVARHLAEAGHGLRLMQHRTPLPSDLGALPNVTVCRADLARPDTLAVCCDGMDAVVHLAGVLFRPRPHRFLHETNVEYVRHLLDAAGTQGVRKFLLVSFPHAEGETTHADPATERLDRAPRVIHFRTRLEAERLVMSRCGGANGMMPLILRAGVVYGCGMKLTEAARWLLRHRLMAVWRRPTWLHLIALPDLLDAIAAALEAPAARGIYNVCDDEPTTVQQFLDAFAHHLRRPRPLRLPAWMFRAAGALCEAAALVLRTPAPLTRDIVRAAMTSCVADTARMKRELLPKLRFPSLKEGLDLL